MGIVEFGFTGMLIGLVIYLFSSDIKDQSKKPPYPPIPSRLRRRRYPRL